MSNDIQGDSARRTELMSLALQDPDFSRLWSQWNESHVSHYIRALCTPENAADTLEHIESDSLDGLASAYHERAEIEEAQKLFNEYVAGDESFFDLLDSGRIQKKHVFFRMPGEGLLNLSYLTAHKVAMQKEAQFVQRIAEMKGQDLSLAAIALTRPTSINEYCYSAKLIDQLHRPEYGEMPNSDELHAAFQFWKSNGAVYVKEATELIANHKDGVEGK